MDKFFIATAYTLGSMIPTVVEEKDYGLATKMLIESFANGVQTGMKMVGAKGEMTIMTMSKD